VPLARKSVIAGILHHKNTPRFDPIQSVGCFYALPPNNPGTHFPAIVARHQ
jgi:hypothetical protein